MLEESQSEVGSVNLFNGLKLRGQIIDLRLLTFKLKPWWNMLKLFVFDAAFVHGPVCWSFVTQGWFILTKLLFVRRWNRTVSEHRVFRRGVISVDFAWSALELSVKDSWGALAAVIDDHNIWASCDYSWLVATFSDNVVFRRHILSYAAFWLLFICFKIILFLILVHVCVALNFLGTDVLADFYLPHDALRLVIKSVSSHRLDATHDGLLLSTQSFHADNEASTIVKLTEVQGGN